MAFKFTLQPVLEQRKAREERVQRDYSEAFGRLEKARQQRRLVEADIDLRTEEIRRLQRSGIPYARREIHERWIESQQGMIQVIDQQIRQIAEEVERHRQRLVKAVQDRTIMEKLREKEMADFRLAERKAELKLFDEIAVRDYIDSRRQEKNAGLAERIAG